MKIPLGESQLSTKTRRPGILALFVAVITALGLGALHLLWYSRVVAYYLWEKSGGIVHCSNSNGTFGSTCFGAIDWAWTLPIHLPGGVFIRWAGPLCGVLIFGGSLAWGIAVAAILYSLGMRHPRPLGRRWWRLWVAICGLVWIPVPAQFAWIYAWTVLY